MAPEAKRFIRRIALLMATKTNEVYSQVMCNIRTRLSMDIMRSVLVAVRGVRGKAKKAWTALYLMSPSTWYQRKRVSRDRWYFDFNLLLMIYDCALPINKLYICGWQHWKTSIDEKVRHFYHGDNRRFSGWIVIRMIVVLITMQKENICFAIVAMETGPKPNNWHANSMTLGRNCPSQICEPVKWRNYSQKDNILGIMTKKEVCLNNRTLISLKSFWRVVTNHYCRIVQRFYLNSSV